MANPKFVFVVGSYDSLKTNQWHAMTPNELTANQYAKEHNLPVVKKVPVNKKGGPKHAGD